MVRGTFNYLGQTLLSTAGALAAGSLLGVALDLLVALLFLPAGKSWPDYAFDRPLLGLNTYGEPYFALPVMAAFLLGIFFAHRSHSGIPMWVWVLPVFNLIAHAAALHPYGTTYWKYLWSNYFGYGCGATECIFEFLVTAPVYTSVAYSLGWLLGRRTLKDRCEEPKLAVER